MRARSGEETALALGLRALGPGSVSSFLKAVLDVVYYALFVAAAVTALGAVAALLAQPFLNGREKQQFGVFTDLVKAGPALAGWLAMADLYIAALIVAVGRTRKVFATMIAGDPFQPANVDRLRVIGFALAAMETVSWGTRMVTHWLAPQLQTGKGALNLTAWFAVLVLFVLAEVFREGARLRAAAELTV